MAAPISVLNYANFIAAFPEFTTVPEATVQLFYTDKTPPYFRNDASGPATTPAAQAEIMNLLTAHLLKVNGYPIIPGVTPTPITGRISSASEGSVSVGTELNLPASAAFFSQTAYGIQFWQATAAYRTARYIRPIGHGVGGILGAGGFPGGQVGGAQYPFSTRRVR